jgi:pantoate--beta-alanine ligase
MKVKIKVSPIVREKDGLAMSSRNSYLSPQERIDATVLYQSLQQARKMIKSNVRDPQQIKLKMRELISRKKSAKIDYIAIVAPKTLEEVKKISGGVCVLLAVWIGKTRLIDNIIVKGRKIK